MNAPGSRRDHNRFCQLEGWTEVRNARGGTVSHHLTYELSLPDGRILRTRISRPPNNATYGPRLWKTILTDQLQVTEPQFWACVSNKIRPDRGTSAGEPPTNALPADLVYQLIHMAGVPESEVAGMTLQCAAEVMVAHWSRPRD
ncbi:hypothetical protein [Blastococcus saxobsidens]|uniref:Putative Cytotoxic translational repressor of toxin-antitoxin stability system, putative toxin of TAS system n=1 Tax=Blastococcus saxobsidens (strain DD2) TaxID=1146883 RepID=H6RU82_BLASD|nr:hypothetical protein [Blastococcus saxobsidens]CCG05689.1 Putative Cytotoxic translational repressor of toxin-antitoxin stability system, putative toxin of TAS system [Blastococcus saxobsidens DD2]